MTGVLQSLRSLATRDTKPWVSGRPLGEMWPPCVSPASKGLLDAAHFCYLMAQVGFGVYTKKTTKLVLIGSNHR